MWQKLDFKRSESWRIILFSLVALHLLPIWIFPFFPTQDGVSHVYNAHVLREYWNPAYDFQTFYDINWNLFPNWLSHFVLAALMLVIPPLLAEKLFLSIYVILFPLAISYFLRSLHPDQKPTIPLWISFFFIYNYLFLMGFYNYAVSIPLFFLMVGYWWRHKEGLHLRQIITLNLLFVVTYFAHLVPYVFTIGAIGLLSLVTLFRTPKQLLVSLASLLPPSLLLLIYLPTSDLLSGGQLKIGFGRVGDLFSNFLNLKVLVALDDRQATIAKAVTAILVLYLVYSLWQQVVQGPPLENRAINQTTAFGLLFIALFVQYLIYPNSVGPGGWLNDRIAILSALVLLAVLVPIHHPMLERIFGAVVLALLCINLLNFSVSCHKLNGEIREFNTLRGEIGQNKVLLPFFFDPSGSAKRVGIFVNGSSYYCLANGGINLGNYEVQFDYFPINFKESFQPPIEEKEWVQAVHWRKDSIDLCGYAKNVNYVLVWGEVDQRTSQALNDCYQLVADRGKLKLYRGQRNQ